MWSYVHIFKEKDARTISLTEKHPQYFGDLLQWIYTGTVNISGNIDALFSFAHFYDIKQLTATLLHYSDTKLSVGNCLKVLLAIQDFENMPELIEKCVAVAAAEFPFICHHPEFVHLNPEIFTKIIKHSQFSFSNEATASLIIFNYGSHHNLSNQQVIKLYSQIPFGQTKKIPIGSAIVCFFADGTQKYNKMTSLAIRTFLINTPKIYVGLLTHSEDVYESIIKELPNEHTHRIIHKKTSNPYFENWNPTQYKLDVQLFLEDGFNTIFWIDSDTLCYADMTSFLQAFVQSDCNYFLTPDHVMLSADFEKNWKVHHKSFFIPQACLMGFKSSVIEEFFRQWRYTWSDWILPAPFARYGNPNPNFVGSEFCIEQYALGAAISSLNLDMKNVMVFPRSLVLLPNSNLNADKTTTSFSQSLLFALRQVAVITHVSQLLHTSNLVQQSKYTAQGIIMDSFGNSILHCYNHQYDLIREWFEANYLK